MSDLQTCSGCLSTQLNLRIQLALRSLAQDIEPPSSRRQVTPIVDLDAPQVVHLPLVSSAPAPISLPPTNPSNSHLLRPGRRVAAPFPLDDDGNLLPLRQPAPIYVSSDSDNSEEEAEGPTTYHLLYPSPWVEAHHETSITTSSGRKLPGNKGLLINAGSEDEAATKLIQRIEDSWKPTGRSFVDTFTAADTWAISMYVSTDHFD